MSGLPNEFCVYINPNGEFLKTEPNLEIFRQYKEFLTGNNKIVMLVQNGECKTYSWNVMPNPDPYESGSIRLFREIEKYDSDVF